jgi:hypothetical protein
MSGDPTPGSAVPNQFMVTLHASADFEAHLSALRTVIDSANASGEEGAEPGVVSCISLNVKGVTGLPIYGGIFGTRVLRWINEQEAVKTVAANVYLELD